MSAVAEQCPKRPKGYPHEQDETRRVSGSPVPCVFCGVGTFRDGIPPQLVWEQARWAERPVEER